MKPTAEGWPEGESLLLKLPQSLPCSGKGRSRANDWAAARKIAQKGAAYSRGKRGRAPEWTSLHRMVQGKRYFTIEERGNFRKRVATRIAQPPGRFRSPR